METSVIAFTAQEGSKWRERIGLEYIAVLRLIWKPDQPLHVARKSSHFFLPNFS